MYDLLYLHSTIFILIHMDIIDVQLENKNLHSTIFILIRYFIYSLEYDRKIYILLYLY